MLTLTRRIGEKLHIGKDLTLEVIDLEKPTAYLELERPDPGYPRTQWINVERQSGETFQLAPQIIVHVGTIHRSQIKLSIDAPESVPIFRSELNVTATYSHKSVQILKDNNNE